MNNAIDSALLDEQPDDSKPTFLYSTPDGFEDRDEDTICNELVAQLVSAKPLVKFFDDEGVHTSEDCGSDPDCTRCNDPKALPYVRLRLDVDGAQYQLDLTPNARKRFIPFARKIAGIDGAPVIRMTSTRKERSNGRPWAHIKFALVSREAA